MFSSLKFRKYAFQAALLLGLIALFWFLYNNAEENMSARNIEFGFNFLNEKAGFPILFSPFIEYNPASSSYFDTYLIAIGNTVLVGFLGIITATIVGFIVGIARLSKNWLVSKIASAYVEIFRNIPLLLQITFWYFVVIIPLLPIARESFTIGTNLLVVNNRGIYIPEPYGNGFEIILYGIILAIFAIFFINKWINKKRDESGKTYSKFLPGLGTLILIPSILFFILDGEINFNFPEKGSFSWSGGLVIIPELSALWIALTIYTGAFIAENIRGGILAINKGQTEAAKSLSLSRLQTLRLVIIPQALRVIIPPQANQYLNLVKNSSLATAIGYPDLVSVFTGTALNQVGRAIEIISMTMLVYLSLSFLISILMNIYNNKTKFKQ
jgi:general L-amino acid transport system permease protein